MTEPPELEVIICTFDNARLLDATLASLGRQQVAAACRWGALVVDNNSSDETGGVLERHVAAGLIPDLRVVREARQGLTYARLRGLACTTARWLAYVDDDCLLDEDWVGRAIAFGAAHPNCGAFGGRVSLSWESRPPPLAEAYDWCYAAQDHGPDARRVEFVVGAGLVVRRLALSRCGWSERPLLHDRVGRRLVSGGDVEMVLRVRAAGFELWYEPSLELRHVIAQPRTTTRYLRQMTDSLGMSQALADALLWSGSTPSWAATAAARASRYTQTAGFRAAEALRRRRPLEAAALDFRFARGYWRGVFALLALPRAQRQHVLGSAAPGSGS